VPNIYFCFEIESCVMGIITEYRVPVAGEVIVFKSGFCGSVDCVCRQGSLWACRLSNAAYSRDAVTAETVIERLRRQGWERVAKKKNGKWRAVSRRERGCNAK
jgi:hypothetical protein